MNKHSDILKNEQTKTLYINNQHGWFGTLILWIALLFAYNFPNQTASYIFSGCILLSIAFHIINTKRYANQKLRDALSNDYWIQVVTANSAIAGFTIGLSPWFILNINKPSEVYLIAALLIMPMFGSAIVSGTAKEVHLAWCLSSTLPLAAFLTSSGHREYEIMGLMIVITGIPTSILMNVYFFNLFTKTIKLQYENLILLTNVQKQKLIAEKESAEKTRFIAATSHDLRQPLHALNLYLAALKPNLEHKNDCNLLNKAQESSQALNDLLNALMDMSRLDAGVVTVNRSLHNVEELIKLVITEVTPLLKNKNITLHAELERSLINIDPVLFNRIIRNLVLNAIHHNDHCEIKITMKAHQNELLISIIDSGQGIAESNLDMIFSEFYQSENPERDRDKGLGLGLAIVKKLSTLLDIQLSVKSQLDKGTCFYLRLLTHTDAIISSLQQQHQSTLDLTGQFIMIVDDDLMVCDAINTLLKRWDCNVLIAQSEDELMKTIVQQNTPCPDILISDYHLKNKKNGAQLIQAVRSFYNKEIPSIIMSGDTSNIIKKESHDISYVLLFKPVESQQLRLILEKIKINSHYR